MNAERPVLTLAAIEAFDPQGATTQGAGRARFCCPLCGESKPRDAAHRSLSLDRGTGMWKCFRCGGAGRLREFWAEREAWNGIAARTGRQQARERLQRAVNWTVAPLPASRGAAAPVSSAVPLSSSAPFSSAAVAVQMEVSASLEVEPAEVKRLLPWHERVANWQALSGTPGERYMARRGIPLLVAEAAAVHFSPSWFGRASVMFPICLRGGEMVASQGRAVQGDAKMSGGPKSEGAFFAPAPRAGMHDASGLPLCFQPLGDNVPAVVLTEAPIDALSLAACGFPALALCGTTGPRWLHLACGLRRVVLAFDADDAGDKAAIAIAERLMPYGARCERLAPQGAKDWNEMLLRIGRDALADWLTPPLILGGR